MHIFLTGEQLQDFQKALVSAFPSYDGLKRMLRFELDRRLEELVGTGALSRVTFDLLEVAEAEGWLYELLKGARRQNPGNTPLLEFERSISLSARDFTKEELEARIRESDKFISLKDWLPKLLAIEKQVCRVEIFGKGIGTGFLLAPNIVLTNFHVIENVLLGKWAYSDIQLRFDFKNMNETSLELEGESCELAQDWLIGHDTYQTEMGLDYALLRLKDSLADRGCIPIPEISDSFYENYREDSALFIVQHPRGAPLKLALDTESVIALNDTKTRLFYRTRTEPGSSGSPCFNADWELIALHRSGFEGVRNGGVPVPALLESWRDKGLDTFF